MTTYAVDYGQTKIPYSDLDQWQRDANAWTLTITGRGRRVEFPYFTGPAITDDPTAADILECLRSDADLGSETFPDFCANLGYDEDSRAAYRIWEACKRTAQILDGFGILDGADA